MSGVTPAWSAANSAPGTPEAGRDLVEDQQDPVRGGDLPQHPQVLRVVEPHPARALHDRLDDDRGELVGVPLDHVGQLGGIRLVEVGRRRHPAKTWRGQHPGPQLVHAADRVADAHRVERVAVIPAAPGGEPLPPGRPRARWACSAILIATSTPTEPESQRKTCSRPVRGDLDQGGGELDGGRVGEPAEHHVAHPAGLVGRARRPAPGAGSRGWPPTTTTSRRPAPGRRPAAAGRPRHSRRRRARCAGHRPVGMPDVRPVKGEQPRPASWPAPVTGGHRPAGVRRTRAGRGR